MPLSPCAAANSAHAGKNSGRPVHTVSSFHPQICRTPNGFSRHRPRYYCLNPISVRLRLSRDQPTQGIMGFLCDIESDTTGLISIGKPTKESETAGVVG